MKSLSVVLAGILLGASGVRADQDSPEAFPRPKPVPAPSPGELDGAIRRGVSFLVKDQNKDGSWGTPHRTKELNIYAPVPGAHEAFRSAVTALCVASLIEVGGDSADVRRAVEHGEEWIFAELPQLRRSSPDALYNIWGHIYGIQALVRMHQRVPDDQQRRRKIEGLIREQMGLLDRFASVDGGWGYYDFRSVSQRPGTDSMSFMSAAALVAMHEAKQIGVEPTGKWVQRAIDSIHRQQKPDFTYLYGEYLKWKPMMAINRPGGSLGRSQACNEALALWGDRRITEEVFKTCLDRLFSRNGWLDMGRKRPIPHESYFQVAGYFFYFGHYYAALCIDRLRPEDRPFYQHQLARLLLSLQEKDGCWWDFPLYDYHFQYGTAFALLSLKHCRPEPNSK